MHSFAVINNRKSPKVDSFELPFSKSLSNRLLILRYLAGSSLQIRNLSSSDDTVLLNEALEKVKHYSLTTITKHESTTFESDFVELECKNAGTACRFLLSLLSITSGKWLLNADQRMEQRPIIPLIECLKSLGADIESVYPNKIFPLRIKGKQLKCSGLITLPSNLSSQFISSLAMIAPYVDGGLRISLHTSQVSLPYIKMTLKLMQENGAEVKIENNVLSIGQKQYRFEKTDIEADWSAAAFAYSIVALGKIESFKINGLNNNSLQGDAIVAELFSKYFGVQTLFNDSGVCLYYNENSFRKKETIEIDFSSCPDLFLPLVVTAVCLNKSFVFNGLETLSYKESDRLNNVIDQIRKEGMDISYENGEMKFKAMDSCKELSYDLFEANSYNDHRMAMAMSLFAFKYKSVKIQNPDCVDKSFPDYWKMLSHFFEVSLI